MGLIMNCLNVFLLAFICVFSSSCSKQGSASRQVLDAYKPECGKAKEYTDNDLANIRGSDYLFVELPKICKGFAQKCLIDESVSDAERENGIISRNTVVYKYVWQYDVNSKAYKFYKSRSGKIAEALFGIVDESWHDDTVGFKIEQLSNGQLAYNKMYSTENLCDEHK